MRPFYLLTEIGSTTGVSQRPRKTFLLTIFPYIDLEDLLAEGVLFV